MNTQAHKYTHIHTYTHAHAHIHVHSTHTHTFAHKHTFLRFPLQPQGKGTFMCPASPAGPEITVDTMWYCNVRAERVKHSSIVS